MPSLLLPREISALKSWRDPSQLQQNRSKSTTTEHARPWEEDSGASTFLYGGNVAREPKPPAGSSSAMKQAQTHASPVSPRNPPIPGGVYNVQERYRRKAASSQTLPRTLPNKLAKRSPSRLRDRSRPTLKKGNVFQIPKPVPTHNDYPDLPELLFTRPKLPINNTLQGIADFHSDFSSLGPDWFRCTVTCVFHEDGISDIVIGEGTTKVTLTDGCFDEFSNGI